MNFDFLKDFPDFKPLYQICYSAEKNVLIDPPTSISGSRSALEYIVKFIYKSALDVDIQDKNLCDMLREYSFVKFIGDEGIISEMHTIRKFGNSAIHDHIGSKSDAIDVLESLLYVVGELFITLGLLKDYPDFVCPTEEQPAKPAVSAPTVAVKAVPVKEITVDDNVAAKFAVTMRHARFDVSYKRDEEQNRRLFIKASLREAGWPIVEVDNRAKPFCAGINIKIDETDSVDYVLFGKDGKPVAIIEYGEFKENMVMGRQKAKRVANKLELMYGVLPVIYLTNGYKIQFIDQIGYQQRQVFSFHSLQEIEWIQYQKKSRKLLENLEIRDDITDREYQHKAIKAVCGAFSQLRRGSLIVMATGTGKTRVAVSIVDVLMRYGWVKDILFLADRTSLVRQAMKNFKKLMPDVTTSLYSGESLIKDPNARMIFSTYQSMIRIVNSEQRTFGVGRFDLIIVDEAHRSIFTKYAGLFEYFDALMLGLTATPKYEQDKSSYKVFKMPNPEPDFAYELEEALEDKYLVGFAIKDRTTEKNLRRFKYSDLSPEEIAEIESSVAENYSQKELNYFRLSHSDKSGVRTNTINRGTIRIMLDDLMDEGLKLSDGTLGKTIIFAETHEEAMIIVEEFNNRYSSFGPDFCKVIDSKIPERYALIDKLEKRDSGLNIAVSVEMLDTGIDIPDVLNLVFFKPTMSKIRFLQMIGRGTRLSKDLFGPGLDKKGFFVFDYFGNFTFFSTGATWSTIDGSGSQKSFKSDASESDMFKINKYKMSIAHYTQTHLVSDEDKNYGRELVDDLVGQLNTLDNGKIDVHQVLPYVNKYRTKENWERLNEVKIKEIAEKVLKVCPSDGNNPKVRWFDSVMYSIEEQVIWLPERQPKRRTKTISDIRIGSTLATTLLSKIADTLEEHMDEPEISSHEKEIKRLHNGESVLNDFSLAKCEKVRKELRGLMIYIPLESNTYVIDVEDQIIKSGTDVMGEDVPVAKQSYPERATEFISNSEDIVFMKLQNLEKLTEEDKAHLTKIFTQDLGTSLDFAMWSNNKPMFAFLRSRVGINDSAISVQFGTFLNTNVLNEQQYELASQIVKYAKVNGDVTFKDLGQSELFKNIDFTKTFGTNAKYIKQLVSTIHDAIS